MNNGLWIFHPQQHWAWFVLIGLLWLALLLWSRTKRTGLALATAAFIIYAGFTWRMYDWMTPWLSWVFWIALAVGVVIGIVRSLAGTGTRAAPSRYAAWASTPRWTRVSARNWGSWLAMLVTAVLMVAGMFQYGAPWLDDAKDVAVKVLTQADVDKAVAQAKADAEKTAKAELDKLQQQIDALKADKPATPAPVPATTSCSGTWKIKQVSNGRDNWFDDGIREIREADTPAESRAAVDVWMNRVKTDPELLSAAIKSWLNVDVSPSDLTDGDCMSADAPGYVADIKAEIANARSITPDVAPASGYNSGAAGNGNVIDFSDQPGITGNRTAVKVVLDDGRVIWIMGRCGNIVTREKIVYKYETKVKYVKPPTVKPPTTKPPTGGPPPEKPPVCDYDKTRPVDWKPGRYEKLPELPCWKKIPQSHDDMRDGGDAGAKQPVQDNDTSGVDTGPTPGAGSEPPADQPTGNAGTEPTTGGTNSGGGTGTAPGGTSTDSGGTTSGGSTPTGPAEDSGQGGTGNGTDPGAP